MVEGLRTTIGTDDMNKPFFRINPLNYEAIHQLMYYIMNATEEGATSKKIH